MSLPILFDNVWSKLCNWMLRRLGAEVKASLKFGSKRYPFSQVCIFVISEARTDRHYDPYCKKPVLAAGTARMHSGV